MEESIKCECGNNKLWWFGDYLRCPECHNEFKMTGWELHHEFWFRRFNLETHQYADNWEHVI